MDFDPFCVFLFQGSLLVIVIMITAAKNAIVKVALNFRVRMFVKSTVKSQCSLSESVRPLDQAGSMDSWLSLLVYFWFLRWPIKDMKPQLFILGNLNGKTYYFTFGVLFSDLSFFPLLKPKFFFLNFILKHFLKLRFFQNSRFFF